MKRICLALSAMAVMLLSASSAHAAVAFETEITLNLSAFTAGGLSNIDGVAVIDTFGRVVADGTDVDGSGTYNVGDTSLTYGAARTQGFLDSGDNPINPLGQPFDWELTFVLKNWAGEVVQVNGTEIILDYADGGTLDVYFSYHPGQATADLDLADASTWETTGSLVATFELDNSLSPFPNNTSFDQIDGSGDTKVSLALISQAGDATPNDPSDDFFTVPGFDSLVGSNFLATFLDAADDIFPGSGTGASVVVPTNLDDIFDTTNFNPAPGGLTPTEVITGAALGNWDYPFDAVAQSDPNATFGIVPEPSSVVLMAMGGVALAGVAVRRRRNAKKNA